MRIPMTVMIVLLSVPAMANAGSETDSQVMNVKSLGLEPVGPASDDSPENHLLSRMFGKWEATGNSFSDKAKANMAWSMTLDGKFMRVDYAFGVPGGASFDGTAHYRMSDGDTTQGYWADSTGDLHRLSATMDDKGIRSIWGEAGAKQGRTDYTLQDDGSVVVTDWLLTEKGWREFNRTVFRRVAG